MSRNKNEPYRGCQPWKLARQVHDFMREEGREHVCMLTLVANFPSSLRLILHRFRWFEEVEMDHPHAGTHDMYGHPATGAWGGRAGRHERYRQGFNQRRYP